MIFNWKSDSFKPLKKLIGKSKVLTDQPSITLYGMDATNTRGEACAVVFPENEQDVLSIVQFALENSLCITPRGAGSGLSGGSVPLNGSMVVSFERMRTIESIDIKTSTAIVQPGVVTSELQNEAAKVGLFYPPDPSSYSISTIGGNVAENAGGLRCFKYGVTGQYVLGIEYVNGKAELQQTGVFSNAKNSPDLTHLLIGSEGTLGVFTRIALRLIKAPSQTVTICAFYPTIFSALSTVEDIVKHQLLLSVMEIIDEKALKAAANYISVELPEGCKAMLLLELDGEKENIEKDYPKVLELLKLHSISVETANDKDHRDRMWKMRRSISPSLSNLSNGKIHEDIAVPRGNLASMADKLEEIRLASGLEIAVYGHAGDGNLHIVILHDSLDQNQVKKAQKCAEDVYKAAIELGGTISGEHGIGIAKRHYLKWQLPEKNIDLMKNIKKILDPSGVFNPDKIF